MMGVKHATPC